MESVERELLDRFDRLDRDDRELGVRLLTEKKLAHLIVALSETYVYELDVQPFTV
jgi:hypothetical protein